MFRCIWYDLYILPVWKYEFYVLKVRKRKLLENVNKGFLLKLVIRKVLRVKLNEKIFRVYFGYLYKVIFWIEDIVRGSNLVFFLLNIYFVVSKLVDLPLSKRFQIVVSMNLNAAFEFSVIFTKSRSVILIALWYYPTQQSVYY